MDGVSQGERKGGRNHGKLSLPSESKWSKRTQQKILKGRKRAREMVAQKVKAEREFQKGKP